MTFLNWILDKEEYAYIYSVLVIVYILLHMVIDLSCTITT